MVLVLLFVAWLTVLREAYCSPALSAKHQEVRERILDIQNELATKYASPEALSDLEAGAVDHLGAKLKKFLLSQWSIDASLLDGLPLAILSQLSPTSPLSLVGCPGGTVPFDLKTCTAGILAEEDIAGVCLGGNAVYSRHLQSCATQSEAKPYTLCPDGFRITLPPVDIAFGPCQSQEVIPAIRTCDSPYRLLEGEGVCIKSWATAGYIGCRPGEIRRGRTCYVAVQQLLEVQCSDFYVGRIRADGTPECFRETTVTGKWNIWTKRPICPPKAKTIVQRYSTVESDSNFVTSQPNVTCVETSLRSPISVKCPEGSIPFDDYVSLHQNSPPVQFNGEFGNPKGTCMILKDFPIGPACPKTDQRVLLDGGKAIVSQALALSEQRIREEKKLRTIEIEQNLLSSESKKLRRLGRRKEKRKISEFVKVDEPISYYPSTNSVPQITEPSQVQVGLYDHHRTGRNHLVISTEISDGLSSEEEVEPTSDRTTTISTEPPTEKSTAKSITTTTTTLTTTTLTTTTLTTTTLTTTTSTTTTTLSPNSTRVVIPPPGKPIIDVKWESLILADALTAQIEDRLGISASDIDWITPFIEGKFRVVCESTATAQFYLSCPEKFRLRKDGSCRGFGFANFLVLCPEGFALDQLSLSSTTYRFPQASCVGQVPAATRYYCPSFSDEFEGAAGSDDQKNNTDDEKNKTVEAVDGDVPEGYEENRARFPFLEDGYAQELLMLQFLTDSVKAATQKGGTAKASVQGTPIGVASLADLLDQFDTFHQHKKGTSPWDMLRDYPQLDRLIVTSVAAKKTQAAQNTSNRAVEAPDPQHSIFSPSGSSSVQELDRDYLHFILSTMSPLSAMSSVDLNRTTTESESLRSTDNNSTTSKERPTNSTLDVIQDEYMKRCYKVERVPVWYTPTPDTVLGLYGHTFGGEFLSRVDRARRTGGSPFYPLLPKLVPQRNSSSSITLEEIKLYTRMQQAPQFGPRSYPKLRQPEVPIPPTQQ